MAKVLWTEDEDQFNMSHPGCMFGIFHQYWHSNVKKILPHRKHPEALINHSKRNKRYKKMSDDEDPFEVLKLLDAATSHILVDQTNKRTSCTQKKSLKARIKALVTEENDTEQDPDFVPSPKLQRTYSIHHLETNEWVHPIIFFPENDTKSHVCSKTHSNVTHPEINDSRDILEMFEVDKEIFENILQDRSQASDRKQKLTKSDSFPMKLKDKINEIYRISKAKKRLDSEKNSNYNLNDNNVTHLRRISSFNESTYRCVGKEATLHRSMSLKLKNESENLFGDEEPTSFHHTYFRRSCSQKERNPVSLLLSTDNCTELNNTQDCESLNELMDKSDDFFKNERSPKANSPAFGEVTYGLTSEEGNHQISQYEKVQSKLKISEDFEKEIKIVTSKKHMESSMRYYYQDDDFTYVKQILQRSGFINNGFQQTWYSSNQPLDPFIFQEIESQYFHDPKLFAEEINELSHRLLIFDLVDDVLLTMYERLLTYYPKSLSSSCHIHPAPNGLRVLDEVWKLVSRLVNLKPDMYEPLDHIVSRDWRNDDSWMNLQLDSECVALDMEDLILDEVLEEVLFESFLCVFNFAGED